MGPGDDGEHGATGEAGPIAPATEADSGSNLCRSCGLCCDGTLFGHVPITAEEGRRLGHRLPILAATRTLELRFEQRCVALGPRGCDVYGERPETCSRFRCKLLRRVESRDITADDALAIVVQIQATADRLDRSLPLGKNFHVRKALLPEVGERTSREMAPIVEATWAEVNLLEALLRRELRADDGETGGAQAVEGAEAVS